MSESHVSPTAPSAGDAVHAGGRPPDAASVTPPRVAARPSRWTVGRTTALVIGALLVLFSLILLGAGGTALWADRTQREAGYVTTDVHDFSTSGSALATESTELGAAGVGWLYSPSVMGRFESGSRRRARTNRRSWGSARPRLLIATSPE